MLMKLNLIINAGKLFRLIASKDTGEKTTEYPFINFIQFATVQILSSIGLGVQAIVKTKHWWL